MPCRPTNVPPLRQAHSGLAQRVLRSGTEEGHLQRSGGDGLPALPSSGTMGGVTGYRSTAGGCPGAGLSALGCQSRSMGSCSGTSLYQPGRLHHESSGRATVQRLLAAERGSASRSAGNQAMILTREEIAFLDVYCHEGTEPPFGGPATDAMTSIGVHSGDTSTFNGPTFVINPRPARSSETPAPWLRRFLGPIVRPFFAVTQRFGSYESKCNVPAAASARQENGTQLVSPLASNAKTNGETNGETNCVSNS